MFGAWRGSTPRCARAPSAAARPVSSPRRPASSTAGFGRGTATGAAYGCAAPKTRRRSGGASSPQSRKDADVQPQHRSSRGPAESPPSRAPRL
ncbi:hypothetical protein EEZ25_30060 [Micromonospora aurantiaca]|nr:hypothetical protein EEZ25_30060 [Micromonospora aurantiaca]